MKILQYKGFLYVALVAVFSAYLVSQIVKYVYSAPHPVMLDVAVSAVPAETLRGQTALNIMERNLFHIEKVVEISEAPDVPVSAPFNGKLTGAFVAAREEDSRAIIVLDNKDVYVLRVNKEQDGYMLKQLTYDSAVVVSGGREYTLVLDPTGVPGAPSAVSSVPVTRPASSPSQAVSSGGTEQYTLERSALMEQLKDVNTVIKSLLVSPLYVDNEFVGYRVARMNDDSPMRVLGLLPGDVINRINGEDLTSPELLFSMMSKLDDINAVSIDITRDGEKKTLFVEIQ